MNCKVSIVIPVHNEERCIEKLYQRLCDVTGKIEGCRFEILFVDDGSSDSTYAEIEKLFGGVVPVCVIKFSKNFGHQAALEAGLAHCNADAAITMDGDLQHPPEEIPGMIEEFKKGADVVQMQRKNVAQDFKGLLSMLFYSFFKAISSTPMVSNAADFRLISKRVLKEINSYPGRGKLLRAMIPSIGFNQVYKEYTQDDRKYGQPSYSFFSSYELALQLLFKFSRFPAHLLLVFGFSLVLSGILFLLLHLAGGVVEVPHAMLIALVILCSGFIVLSAGIISWYLYFVLEQFRQEKTYIIEKFVSSANSQNLP